MRGAPARRALPRRQKDPGGCSACGSLGAATPFGARCKRGGLPAPSSVSLRCCAPATSPLEWSLTGAGRAIVWAPLGKPVGAAVWDSSLWSEEPETFAAFVAMLDRRRFLGVPAGERLPALLQRSASAQEEVTTALGSQARAAVEMLVRELDELDRNAGGTLLSGVSDDDLYAGVVTVMMRVVFLLFAEERRLLPSDDDLYDTALLRRSSRRTARAARRHPRRANPRTPHRRLAPAARPRPRAARRRRARGPTPPALRRRPVRPRQVPLARRT